MSGDIDGIEREIAIKALIHVAKSLACQYYLLTGKPLGVTGEIAEVEAANKLNLRLAGARTSFYDAYRDHEDGIERFQIKGRAVDAKNRYVGRVPSIKCEGKFEYVLLVLLDNTTNDVLEIWQATREDVAIRLDAPGSIARNDRKSLGITQFKSIARLVWPVTPPEAIVRQPVNNMADEPSHSTARQVSTHNGPIGRMIADLLMKPELDYSQIVWRVRQQFPDARTSTKSVASTAKDLRRNGASIPDRRNW